jgi:hypothetical protein
VQVTLWRTTRNNNGLLDSASFPTAVWEWLTEKPQVCSLSFGSSFCLHECKLGPLGVGVRTR